MDVHHKIRQFFFPSITPKFLIRVSSVALSAYLFFGYLCIPFSIRGTSMEPTYHDGGVNFCWRLRYLFSEPKRHDIVTVRFAGSKVMLLKRVIALEGEKIEFRNGKLFVEGRGIENRMSVTPVRGIFPLAGLKRIASMWSGTIGACRLMTIILGKLRRAESWGRHYGKSKISFRRRDDGDPRDRDCDHGFSE